MARDLPGGTVTLLFTDIEGSTRLLHSLGPDAYAAALAEHRRILRDTFSRHDGIEVDTQGDAFFVAFPTAPGGAAAAHDAQAALAPGPVHVRMGLHTGTPTRTEEGYVGLDVHRGARIAALAHGGQILVTEATAALLPDEMTRVDLGRHRVKDFDEPVRLLQLGNDEFPPLSTPSAVDLPVPVTRFVGREPELLEAVALWLDRDPRILTVVGAGGAGKTRFALELAHRLAEDADGGTAFVPLATLREPERIVTTIDERLGAAGDTADAVASRIGERRVHLVLDNLEHLLPNAARLLADLVAAAPSLRLIVTSREPLRIAAEAQLDLPPLREVDATALFVERAQAVRPDLVESDAIHELVRRLDGLPLALELAAARVKLLRPEQLLERLAQRLDLLAGGRDADERHSTLRATIAWSHDLLRDEERALFARLGLFRSGCTFDTAERVCAASLETLEALVDKSLVRLQTASVGDDRFWMLETIREYALEQLEASGERDRIEAARLDHLSTLARSAGTLGSAGGFGGDWDTPAIDAEIVEVRAALAWSTEADPRRGLELATLLEGYWVVRSPLEGAEWLERLVEAAPDADARLRACALRAQGGATEIGGAVAAVRPLYEQSRELFVSVGDEENALHMAFRLAANRANGFFSAADGWGATLDRDVAEELTTELTELLRLFEQREDELGELQALSFLAHVTRLAGDREGALELHERTVALAHSTGWRWWEAGELLQTAVVCRLLGMADRHRESARSGLEIAVELGDRMQAAYATAELAAWAAQRGDVTEAGRLWGAIEAEEDAGPIVQWCDERSEYLSRVCPPDADTSAFDRARADGRLLSLAEAAGLGPEPTLP